MAAETGRYYGIARNNETGIARGMVAGEMYRLGDGWWAVEDWGTWMKEDSADLAFSLRDDGDCNHLVYLGLRAPPQESDFRVRVAGSDGEESGTLDPGEDRWLAFEIGPNPVGSFAVHLRITSSARCDLASKEEMRTVGLGALGFYVCRADDLAARQRFLEAVQFKRLDRLTRRPPKPEERSRSGVIELARDAAEGNGSADCANLKRRADARKHG
jgi:hypothetical protein